MFSRPRTDTAGMARYVRDQDAVVEEVRRPCRLVLTGSGSRADVLVVRCTCMAEVDARVSGRYYNYDPLGEVTELVDAVALWKAHTPHVWRRLRYRAR